MRDPLVFSKFLKLGSNELSFIVSDQHLGKSKVANDGPPYEIHYFRFGDGGQCLDLYPSCEVVNDDQKEFALI